MLIFDRFALDLDRHALLLDGETIAIEPKAFALLAYLANHAERVVAKDELLGAVWKDAFVTESSLTRAMSMLRRSLRDAGAEAPIVRTVQGCGYSMAVPVETRGRAPGRPRGDFVGRADELARIRRSHERSLDAEGGVVLVVGDPGIGKSALLRQASLDAARRGSLCASVAVNDQQRRSLDGPWLQLLAELASRADLDLVSMLGERAADLAQHAPWLVPDAKPAHEHDPDVARMRLYEAVARALLKIAREASLVLVLEDVHEADAATLQLLAFVARRLEQSRCLMICSFRPPDVHPAPALETCIGEMRRSPMHIDEIFLEGLQAAQVGELIEVLTGKTPEAAQLERLLDYTAGNPLFVRESAPMTGLANGPTALSGTLHAVIRERLRQLPDPTRELLLAAAVCGQRFTARRLAAISGQPLQEILVDLEPAERARLLHALDVPGTFEFVHALFRETLYADLSSIERVRLHGRVGDSIAADSEGLARRPWAELSHHFYQAAAGGWLSLAIEFSEAAARHALEHLAFEEASELVARLLDLDDMEPGEPRRRIELMMMLAELRYRSGAAESSASTLEDALALAETHDLFELAAQILVQFADFKLESIARVPTQRIELGLALAPRLAHSPALRSKLLAAVADDLYWGPIERARALNAEAIALARAEGDPGALAYAIGARYRLVSHPDDGDERLALADEAEALADSQNDRSQAFYACLNRLSVYLKRAEPMALQRELLRVESRAAQSQLPSHAAHLGAARSALQLLRGDLEAAERGAHANREAIGAYRSRDEGVIAFAALLGALRLVQGRLPELVGLFDEGVLRYPQMIGFRTGRMLAWLQAGDTRRARHELEALLPDDFEDFHWDWLHGLNLGVCALAADQLDDRPRCEILYRKLASYDGHLVTIGVFAAFGSGDRYRAHLARRLGCTARAIEHLERAIEVEARIGAHIFEARSCLELADLLEDQATPGAQAQRRTLRARARELARRHGQGWSDDTLVCVTRDRETA